MIRYYLHKQTVWDKETGVPSWEDVPEASAEELASLKAEQSKSEISQRLIAIDTAKTRPQIGDTSTITAHNPLKSISVT